MENTNEKKSWFGRGLNVVGVILTAVAVLRMYRDIQARDFGGITQKIVNFYTASVRDPVVGILAAIGLGELAEYFEVFVIITIIIVTLVRSILHFGYKDFFGNYKFAYGTMAIFGLINGVRLALQQMAGIARTAANGTDPYFVVGEIVGTVIAIPILAFVCIFVWGNFIGLALLLKDGVVKLLPRTPRKDGMIMPKRLTSGSFYRSLFLYTFATIAVTIVGVILGSYGA